MTTYIWVNIISGNGPLARYVKLRVAHAPGMPGTFSSPPRVNDPGMHHGTCVTHVPWCMPGSLTSSFIWSRWWGKRSRHSWRMRNPQFFASGKRPMVCCLTARSHYLNQSGLLESNSAVNAQTNILYNEFENYTFEITAISPRDQ